MGAMPQVVTIAFQCVQLRVRTLLGEPRVWQFGVEDESVAGVQNVVDFIFHLLGSSQKIDGTLFAAKLSRRRSSYVLDAHGQIQSPLSWIDEFVDASPDIVREIQESKRAVAESL